MISAVTKEAVFTMKVESDLRSAFHAAAADAHRPASQIVRDLMRDYIKQQADRREYEAFLHAKVAAARSSLREDGSLDHDDVAAEFARQRGTAQP